MKRNMLFPAGSFVIVFVLHVTYLFWKHLRLSSIWFQIDQRPFLSLYVEGKDYFLSLSYALASAFTVYALLRFLRNRKSGIGGAMGGFTLTGILYFGGCFLLGCCGSPMLAVYLNLFGSSFLGLTKQLTFILTLISVVIGYMWMERKSKSSACRCTTGEQCDDSITLRDEKGSSNKHV